MPGKLDLSIVGRRFGWLVVVRFSHMVKKCSYWLCHCDCGAESFVFRSGLLSGRVRSCGCQQYAPGLRKGRPTHGLSRTPEHVLWCAMKARCHNVNSNGYKWYGARGITVCERWRNSFEAFLADVGLRPSALHSLERDDNDGPYEPGNVRWALIEDQAYNKSSTILLEHGGRRLNLKQWSQETGLSTNVLRSRLHAGRSPSDCVTVPLGTRPKKGRRYGRPDQSIA